ncbi:MAG: reverse transcriptase family protein, partial [Candidatus Neomarinimicrobiota bacterium]
KIMIRALAQENLKLNVLCLQETWLDDKYDTNRLKLDGYEPYHPSKRLSDHGGLSIYVDTNLTFDKMSPIKSTTYENQFIKIPTPEGNKNIILGNVYRNPKIKYQSATNSLKTFIKEFKNGLNSVSKTNANILVAGDFNIDLLKVNTDVNSCTHFDALMSLGFLPSITLPTRFSPQHGTSSLIDNIFIRTPDLTTKFSAGVYTSKISDHFACFISIALLESKQRLSNTPPKFVTLISDKPENYEKFKHNIINSNIMTKFDSSPSTLNKNYETFENIVDESKADAFPTRTVRFNRYKHKINDWITNGIIRSISYRDDLYKQFRNATPGSDEAKSMKTNLDTYNGILKSTIRTAKRNYYYKLFDAQKLTMKQTWKNINEILHRKKVYKSLPGHFVIDGKTITDNLEIANAFNSFFTNIGTKLAESIGGPDANISFTDFLTDKTNCRFNFIPVDHNDIEKAIDSIAGKPSCGYDCISTNFMKNNKEVLVPPLTFLINQSLSTGQFPDKLKIAKVTPVYKKDSPNQIDNYRPISLLPAFSKVFERIMHNQLNEYFSSNHLLYDSQYGFRPAHSTELASSELVDRILSIMNSNDIPFSVFMDLSKAFDTLDHHILLEKLRYYGLSDLAMSLLSSYLSDRKQYVVVNDSSSDYSTIVTGVPQGSILGPLLFLIYINDMHRASDRLHILSYADDTTLTGSMSTFVNNDEINKEINKISDWLIINKLSLNVAKTKYMIFAKSNKQIPLTAINMMKKKLERVSTFVFLGLTIDEGMTWTPHLDKISSKISKTIGILCRLKNFIPENILKTIYNALIVPYLNYSILCWGFINTSRIFKLQKKAVRIITGSKIKAHADPIFYKLKLLKIDDIFLQLIFKFCFLHHHKRLPAFHNSMTLSIASQIHGRCTRLSNNPRPPNLSKDYTRQCIRYAMYQIYNFINNPIKLPAKLDKSQYKLQDDDNKFTSKPVEMIKLIFNKLDSYLLRGFANYIKVRFFELYTTECKKKNCLSCPQSN